ncbi:MAG: hypothetical protein D6725_15220 [Planctomycetota bacterium]|nr:MAG: hypothetical protein D6725_15220 [Planctomycetota bacterium]
MARRRRPATWRPARPQARCIAATPGGPSAFSLESSPEPFRFAMVGIARPQPPACEVAFHVRDRFGVECGCSFATENVTTPDKRPARTNFE